MDLEQVVKLLELMESHGLDEVEVEQGDLRIKLKKGGASVPTMPMIAAHVPIVAANNTVPAPAANPRADAEAEDADTVEMPSPMVGTFYRASAPDSDPFVSEGDLLKADTVVCLIEAMKLMNEIKAEIEGEVVKILVENGESVEYGQPLMVIRKTSHPH